MARGGFVAGAFAALLSLVASSRALAEGSRIVVIHPAEEKDILREAAERLRAELVAGGYEVEMVDAENGADPTKTLEDPRLAAAAALTIVPTGDGAAIDVFVADRATEKTLVRKVAVDAHSVPDPAKVLAVRAVELLHASLMEAGAPDGPSKAPAVAEPPSDPPPPPVSSENPPARAPQRAHPKAADIDAFSESPQEVPADEPVSNSGSSKSSGVTLGVAFASLMQMDGHAPALGPAFSGRIALAPHWSVRADVLAPMVTWAREGAYGDMSLLQALAFGGGGYAFVDHGRVIPSVLAEIGFEVAHTAGHPIDAVPGESKTFGLFAAVVGAQLEIEMTRHAEMFADARLVMLPPGAALYMVNEEVGKVGPISFVPTLGFAFSP